MRARISRYSATVDLGAQSDLTSAHEPMSIDTDLAAPNGYAHSRPGLLVTFRDDSVAAMACGLNAPDGWAQPLPTTWS